MRNFQRLAEGLPVVGLVNTLMRRQDLWDTVKVRTSHEKSPHHNVSDILLRFNEIRDDISQVIDDCEAVNYPAWHQLPEAQEIVLNLMRVVRGERLGRVIISRLDPGQVITPHEDAGAPAEYYTRYQVALQSLPGCIFHCEDEAVNMLSGEVYWFDNTKTHSVENYSASERLAMIIDIRTPR